MGDGSAGSGAAGGGNASGQGQSQGWGNTPGTGQSTSETTQSQQSGERPGQAKGGDITGESQTIASFEKSEKTETQEMDDYRPVKDYIREKYKDEHFDDDEKVDRKAYRYIRDLEQYQKDNQEANKRISELFHQYPELIATFQDMDKGADFAEALAINLDPEQRKLFREKYFLDDYTPETEQWAKKKTEREAKYKERQKWQEQYIQNRKESAEALKQFFEENKIDEKAGLEFAKKADEVLTSVYNGKIDKAFLGMLHKALMFDQAVKEAQEVAEVRGRNEAADGKVEKLPVTDGLPELAKGGETKKPDAMPEAQKMIFDIIDQHNKRNNKF